MENSVPLLIPVTSVFEFIINQEYMLVFGSSIVIVAWLYLILISVRAYLHTPILPNKNIFVDSQSLSSGMLISPPCASSPDFSSRMLPNSFSEKTVTTTVLTSIISDCPLVSIIVPARNEQDNIKRCIMSLISQNYPNFEVIVVDDNSTDDTAKIVEHVIMESTALWMLLI